MVDPVIIPRAAHSISRRDIDPDALKVLHRLQQVDHSAYLVGGSVRDLLLGRRPKDFDVGTSAHPHQIKRTFRNCWIIGRRFRLAHVKFGTKTIEVATFRRHVTPGSEHDPDPGHGTDEPSGRVGHRHGLPAGHADQAIAGERSRHAARDRLVHRDNTFGTAEEDAFRRDFTINALFYDVSTGSIIDYVGGRQDLDARLIRCIGDPTLRFVEDPVRMVRAIAFSARLDFRIDQPILDAIATQRAEIEHAAPARMLEELYKILRSGSAERTYRRLADVRLLEHISPELHRRRSDALWRSLCALDAYRARFEESPQSLTYPILLGCLVVPTGLLRPRARGSREPAAATRLTLGSLPVARGHVDRLQQILDVQSRLRDPKLPPRVERALRHRGVFAEALTWLDILGETELLQRWRTEAADAEKDVVREGTGRPRRRRRRRRRAPRPAN